ncbi:porin family protein [Kovacikia minuta CCNUW1]|uniref:porin family protein n=1 Tax=Kovacikia minuta TaxID=2931930 RepID=UPI001CCEFC27|nr:porin family protein [Kovacikia minuta]UBF27750.1 porin family protein [Kovacikia minuta CCNUW1]
MQLSPKISATLRQTLPLGIASTLAIAPLFLSAGTVAAKPIYFDGSYVGAGIAAGVTNGGQQGDAATFGGNIQGRVAIPGAPISVRGAVLFTGSNSTVIPALTYDVPIADNVNVYLGGGYSFVQKDGEPTPLGNRDAAVVMAGAEAGIGEYIVGYGDVKWGIDAYKNSPASALSIQAGLGYRF